MLYSEGLRRLRAGDKKSILEEDKAPVKIKSGLIKSPTPAPVESEDPLSKMRSFAQIIKQSAEEIRGKAEAQKRFKQSQTSEPAKNKVVATALSPEESEESFKKTKSLYDKLKPSQDDESISYSGNASGWLGLMDKYEGGGNYSTLYSHAQKKGSPFEDIDVSRMTIGELKNFSRPNGAYANWVKGQVGRVATPMGRYQFVGSTLDMVAREMGLDDDTVFSPRVQDAMFEYYLKKRLSQGSTMKEKIAQVRGAWEGFKNVPAIELARRIKQT